MIRQVTTCTATTRAGRACRARPLICRDLCGIHLLQRRRREMREHGGRYLWPVWVGNLPATSEANA